MNVNALFQNQKISILQLSIYRAFCELYLIQKRLESDSIKDQDSLQFPLREISKCLIQYFWPFLQNGFVALGEADSIQNSKIKFRKQLSDIIRLYPGEWENAFSQFTRELNLSVNKRLINQDKDLKIKSCLQAIEQAILKGPVSSASKLSELPILEFFPKTNTLLLNNEIKTTITNHTEETLSEIKNKWLELILKWNPDSIYSESDFRKMIYFDSSNKEIIT